MRRSSLEQIEVAISREVQSEYDDIKKVAVSIDSVNTVADNIADVNNVATNMGAVVAAVDAANTISNLDATVIATLPNGSAAAVNLNGSTLEFSLPSGPPGIDGQNGATPIIEFSLTGSTLQYEVTGYEYIPQTPVDEEW